MELRRKERVSYASLFDAPSDEEADPAFSGAPAQEAEEGKGKGKARAPTPSSGESDIYEPEPEPDAASDNALPSDAEPSDASPPPPEEAGSPEEDSDTPAAPKPSGPKRSRALRKLFQRTPSPPPDAPKRVQLTRLAPAPPNKTSATHQAKYSSRLRPVSLYFPPRPRRLQAEPEPYGFAGWGEERETTCAGAKGVLKRLTAAHSKCNGGPRWELLEDRAWFREITEEDMRPRVWEDVRLRTGGVKVISGDEATPYLPSSASLTETGAPQPPPPIACHFGHFGEQTKRTLHMFDSFPLKEHLPSHSHILNAGGPIHSLAWCPTHPTSSLSSHGLTHHLALSPFTSSLDQPTVGQRSRLSEEKGCVQIWAFGPQGAKCEIVLCLEDGPAWELAWCPLPADDLEEKKGTLRKMGLLAGCFRSGHLSIYAVPHPEAMRKQQQKKGKGKGKAGEGTAPNKGEPVYVKLEPVVRLSVDDAGCYCLDWGNSGLIAVGCTNGKIAVFDIASILKDPSNNDPILRLPTHYFPAHQNCVRTIAWIRGPPQGPDGALQTQRNPTMLASGGHDGQMLLVDIRDCVPAQVERMRDWVTSVRFNPFSGGPIFVEQDYRLKHVSIAGVNLGRGTILMDALGPIWDFATSDYHSCLAVASADGAVHLGSSAKHHAKGYPNLLYMLYQLDYNRKTGEYRMLENLKPREARHVEEAYVVNKKRQRAQTRDVSEAADGSAAPVATGPSQVITPSTGAWSPQVGIHRVAWCNGSGLARSFMLASGGASGLVRIDWVSGTWIKGNMPYRKIEVLRGEVHGVDDDIQDQEEDDYED
ncbi:hypothetical protein CALVIDRAFT_30913 [Calocera viscosa TUFC12733]|uniref:WD40 repeat-like protein n=1 Tax=Calocera viscosa (strain TUFC12733) TaxID=1330018 RepID=A0A167PDH7_CALVF|nr:hypothetical protein CALVIDRAFT_30913 [Calocera viscosa TUFC12733]